MMENSEPGVSGRKGRLSFQTDRFPCLHHPASQNPPADVQSRDRRLCALVRAKRRESAQARPLAAAFGAPSRINQDRAYPSGTLGRSNRSRGAFATIHGIRPVPCVAVNRVFRLGTGNLAAFDSGRDGDGAGERKWTIAPRDASASLSPAFTLPIPPLPVPPLLEPLFTAPPPAISTFITRLENISSTLPALLLAHAYVRYLGDLSGSQLIRSRIRRVYSLDPPSTANATAAEETQDDIQFYEFDVFDSADRAADGVKQPTMYERKQCMTYSKEWWRSVLDSGTADGKEKLKRALVDEAIDCFHLSTRIFSVFRPTPPSSTP
ncbi:hypothetical protein QFC21_007136 [Naganishia friedmannii]|uniref:Uncharacterized protein n=1 Tax=Naganishia friedmannii TaxID=89922 RepID=A0ACC2UYW2_9TREE|nr:hypothetical protein QFC21_007136 [Naganishia friedmannii]